MSIATRHPRHPHWYVDPLYPDSDGEPMAENTRQWDWIATIKGGLDLLFHEHQDVFVAGDLLWYPVEGDPLTRTAPDAMVAFGRPKGHRGSYMQWREAGVAPQVVFEILSPGNRPGAMGRKKDFYERFGVEEYYIYDPDDPTLDGYLRDGERLERIPVMDGWVSPRLGVRFVMDGELRLIGPDGRPFATYEQVGLRAEAAETERDEVARERDEVARERDRLARLNRVERQRAEAAVDRAETAEQQRQRLADKLRELGVDPDTITGPGE